MMKLFAKSVLSSVRSRASVSVSRQLSSLPNLDSSPASGPLSNKLFVAGLSWAADEKTLTDAFSAFGDVTEVRIMYDKDTGRSRGFGFVNFSKENDANSAKDAMDGKAFLGRPLRISFALEKVRGGPLVVPRLRSDSVNNFWSR